MTLESDCSDQLLHCTRMLMEGNKDSIFRYYGLWLWLPTLLDDMNKNGGSACDRPPASNSSSSDDCNPGQ